MKKWNKIIFICITLLLITIPTSNVYAANMPTETTTQETTTEQESTQEPLTPPINKVTLKKPQIKNMIATSKGTIKISWKKVRNAQKYRVYRSKYKYKSYKRIATTKETYYTDKTGKANKTYYYRIVPIRKDEQTNSWYEGEKSKSYKIKVRKKAKKIAYVGDSIMTGFGIYHITKSNDKLFAKIGLNATSFYRSELRGQLLRYKPDRLILMFGMNGLPGNPSDVSMRNQVRCINKIIKECRKKNPHMEIVIMGVSPVSVSAHVKLSSVKSFNRKLEKSLRHKSYVHFYNPAKILAGSNGYLKPEYGGGDGIHWSPTAYKKVYKDLENYVKEWK